MLICERRSLVSGTQNKIVVTVRRKIILTRVRRAADSMSQNVGKFRPKLASHYKPVKNEVKFVELSKRA